MTLQLTNTFNKGENIMNNQAKEKFKLSFNHTIDLAFCKIVNADGGTLTYAGGKTLLNTARNIFFDRLNMIPVEVEKSCLFTEALLAPGLLKKAKLLKAAIGIGGSVTGTMMILGAIATALGWGASVWATIVTFFVGGLVAGPLILAGTGMAIIGIAVYFALTGDEAEKAEKFLKILKANCNTAVDEIWNDHGAALSR